MNFREELVGVFGYPVDENPSCVMNNAAFKGLGLNWRYLTLELKPDQLKEGLDALKTLGMKGCNFTIPHKIEVLKYLDELSPAAELIGAVNTLINRDGYLIGENTDGKGFLRSLIESGNHPAGKKVVVLGAGGAARAMSIETALAGAAEITIVNRTVGKARDLAEHISAKTDCIGKFAGTEGGYILEEDVDILVNATSVGLYPNVEEVPPVRLDTIRPGMLVSDAVINPPMTRFLRESEMRGAKILDGLGMLVYQGAIAIEKWTGQFPSCDVMRQSLEEVFAASVK